MNVRELRELLDQFDPDQKVVIRAEGYYYDGSGFEEVEVPEMQQNKKTKEWALVIGHICMNY